MNNINMVIDIGNTHIVLGFYLNSELQFSWRLNTDNDKTEDEYFSIIKQLANEYKLELDQIGQVAISSVVPQITRVFTHLIEKYIKCEIKLVNAYYDLGLKFPIKDPGFIGSDLVVNAFSAKEKYKANCIICDFGTATTIQLVGKDGNFYGTIIAPGVLTSAKNLFNSTALLPNIQLVKPRNLLGTSTAEALCSGIVTGNLFMITGFINAIKKEYSQLDLIKVIATGGISELICEDSREIDIIDKNLTLDGLELICRK
ncbi:MAG: type III pantothenate kinase [Candidatus Cloacimonetes bacterium]|nr:type III pantothenate kinase [Candidatus Cloacimonadota bacterium]